MANLNKVMLIGRLGKDPEMRDFAGGGRVANFSICVTNRKKNSATGQWEDEPCWLDCSAFNRGETGKTADLCEQYLRKGSQAFVEGKLTVESWNDKTSGDKRSKVKILVETVQFLDPPKKDDQQRPEQRRSDPIRDEPPPPSNLFSGSEGDIPF